MTSITEKERQREQCSYQEDDASDSICGCSRLCLLLAPAPGGQFLLAQSLQQIWGWSFSFCQES